MKSLTFGIEIEFTGITRERAANTAAAYFNSSAHFVGRGYSAWETRDERGRTWSFVNDSSVRPETKRQGRRTAAGTQYRVELVSPICSYEDIETVQELTRALRGAGAFVNQTCAIHIHIGKEKFTARTLRNLANIIASKEDLLYQALAVNPNRELTYCKRSDEAFITRLNRKKPANLDEMASLWYQGYTDRRHAHYHPSRYFGLNLHAVFSGPTVEYRYFNGTTHAGKIKSYIQLCLAVSAQALRQKSASAKRTRTTNPKYTFRTWLLRLGLIGDEFKTARLHLLRNLEGDSAFRHGRQAAGF